MRRDDRGSAAALGYGLAFLLAGSALLLQELDLLTLSWTYVLPLILLIVGAVVLLSGFVQARRDSQRTGPGDVMVRPLSAPVGLTSQIGTVVADLPLFLTSPLYRSWHCVGEPPGRVDLADARRRVAAPRAVPVHQGDHRRAPPAAVWPWLVQVGCLRAGFYSNDLLDNLGRPSARTVLPELQQLGSVNGCRCHPPRPRNRLRVDGFDVPRWLLWRKPDSTWAWTLAGPPRRYPPGDPGEGGYDWSRPARRTGRAADGVRGFRDDAADAARHQGTCGECGARLSPRGTFDPVPRDPDGADDRDCRGARDGPGGCTKGARS